MAKIFVDISPLREHPEFRRLWIGNVISQLGTQFSTVAVALEVYLLTGSDLDVGLISTIQLIPALFGSVLGGSVADAMDRRKLLIIINIVSAATALGMAEDVDRHHPSLIILYVLAAMLSLCQSISSPTQTSLLMAIVGRDTIMGANALSSLARQLSLVVGPGLGGILIAADGAKVAFWANAASFVVILASVLSVSQRPPAGGGTPFGWRSIREGFAFIRGRQAIQGCFIADLTANVLGMPTALFPALALHHFHGGAETAGLLYAAPGLGAFLAAGVSAWTMRIRRLGFAVCVAVALWGVAITAFGFVTSVAVALFLLAIAGGADMISAIFRGTIIQVEAPDRLRGRLSSIQTAVVSNGPRLGNTEAGLVAALSNTEISVVTGGIGCVLGIAIVGRFMPHFVNYRLPDKERQAEITTA